MFPLKHLGPGWMLGLLASQMALIPASRAQDNTAPLLEVHFAGLQALAESGRPASLQEAGTWPQSTALLGQTATKLARALCLAAGMKIEAGQPGDDLNQATKALLPLLQDALRSPAQLQLNGPGRRFDRLDLNFHPPPDRLDACRTEARDWLDRVQARVETSNDHELSFSFPHHPGRGFLKIGPRDILVRWSKSGETSVPGTLSSPNLKTGEWARLGVDLGWLNHALRIPGKLPPGRIQARWVAEEKALRWSGTVELAEAAGFKPGKWQVPLKIIHDPIISIAAWNGIEDGLREWPGLDPWAPLKAPNQAYAWAYADIPFQTFMTWPQPNATSAMAEAAPRISGNYQAWAKKRYFSEIATDPGARGLRVKGLPIIVPFVEVAADGNDDHLLAGLFPLKTRPRPLPEALLSQFQNRNDLLYYGWEITQVRAGQWLQLLQLHEFIRQARLIRTENAAQNWLQKALPAFGNTVSTVTLESPRRLSFLRSGPAGFNGLELAWLARWLDAPFFPRLGPAAEGATPAPPLPAAP